MIGNQVSVVGNLTADPELRFTGTGKAVASFSIAHNRKRRGPDGEDIEETSFFDVVAWDTLAENVAESLEKGARILVEGRLEQRSWETDEGKRYKVEIVADEVAPSLRWASVKVTRNERTDGGTPAKGGRKPVAQDEEPW